MKNNSVLVIAAHPDDEILGAGATMARFAQEGHDVFTLILGEGITARDQTRDRSKHTSELKTLKQHIAEANKIVKVKDIFMEDFPDNRFDSVDLLDVVKAVEKVCQKVKPQTIFTHFRSDLNVDHRVTYNAVLTATRPMAGEVVKKIYSFEVLSSTEWNYPLSFSPNVFIDVGQTIDLKVKAMSKYTTELRDFPHPRSLEGIKLAAQYWGMRTGVKFAEAFELVRDIL